MKMVKSLLLGSAAGLIAVAGAQAADLPVKAKAVEYVKICSLYGVGYYYIPGTDTCIKIGGYVRYEAYHNDTTGNYVDRNAAGRFHAQLQHLRSAGPLPSHHGRAHADRIRHPALVCQLRPELPEQRR